MINIIMNLNQRVVTRNGYTIADVLSDLGGLQRVIMSFGGILAAFLNFNNFENYMSSRLYKIPDKKS